jgi:hypothetical protein
MVTALVPSIAELNEEDSLLAALLESLRQIYHYSPNKPLLSTKQIRGFVQALGAARDIEIISTLADVLTEGLKVNANAGAKTLFNDQEFRALLDILDAAKLHTQTYYRGQTNNSGVYLLAQVISDNPQLSHELIKILGDTKEASRLSWSAKVISEIYGPDSHYSIPDQAKANTAEIALLITVITNTEDNNAIADLAKAVSVLIRKNSQITLSCPQAERLIEMLPKLSAQAMASVALVLETLRINTDGDHPAYQLTSAQEEILLNAIQAAGDTHTQKCLSDFLARIIQGGTGQYVIVRPVEESIKDLITRIQQTNNDALGGVLSAVLSHRQNAILTSAQATILKECLLAAKGNLDSLALALAHGLRQHPD